MRFSIINEPLLDIFKDFGNDFALHLLGQFMTQSRQLTQELELTFDRQELQKLRSIASELKKTSGNLGFLKFSTRCASIENAVLKGAHHELPFLVAAIIEEAKLLEMSLCEIKSVVMQRQSS